MKRVLKKGKILFFERFQLISIRYIFIKENQNQIYFLLLLSTGTKYCGIGEDEDMTEFGRYEHTDYCCKQHDLCPLSIKKFGWRFGIMNWRPYTLSSCDCNQRFLRCLQDVDSPVSSFVERIFFKVLKVPCIVKLESGYKVKNSLFGK